MAKNKALALLAFLPFVLAGALFPKAFGGQAAKVEGAILPVQAMQIPEFKHGAGKIFGKLEYLGGLTMATPHDEMGAVSSIRMLPDQAHFISVMDTGHWATGKIERDANGALSGISDYKIYDMLGKPGPFGDDKENFDAEGLLIDKDRIYVSFEGNHRIDGYPYPGFETAMPVSTERPLTGGAKLKRNGSLEALLRDRDDGPLAGALFYVAEKSYNKDGNFIAGVQAGPLQGVFAVERLAPYDVTDGVVMDDGTFLLLERKFGLMDGIGMRIRRFHLADIKPGATIKGETLMEADFSHQIDNMEGLDAFHAPDGSVHLIVVSDDNHSLLERNLMLEFRVVE